MRSRAGDRPPTGGDAGPPVGGAPSWMGRLLGVLAVVALLAVAGISAEIFGQTQELRRNVAATSSIADANVRTVAQTQREVLRLEAALLRSRMDATTAGVTTLGERDRADLELAVALTDQRTQESALPYHSQALQAPELLEQAEAARAIWRGGVRPDVERYLATSDPAALARAEEGLRELELRYNDIARVAAVNRKAVTGQANDNARALLRHSRRLIAVIGASIVLGGAALVGLLVTSRRLSAARRRHQSELMALNAELTGLAEVVRTTGALVASTDLEGRLTWVNDAVARHLGVTPEQLVGHSPHDLGTGRLTRTTLVLADPHTADGAEEVELAHVLAAGEPFVGELVVRPGDGADVAPQHLTVVATPVHDALGVRTGWSVVGNDISDQVAARTLLEQARADAERVADEKSRFLATMSHEIRTPLHAVLGLQEVLAHSDLDAEQALHLRQARSSAQHLLDLVNDVLDFSALDAGRLENLVERYDVRAGVSDIVGLFRHDAAARGLSLDAEVAPDVPTEVLLDGSHVRRVLVNLLGNAVKYTEDGGVRLEVGWEHSPAVGTASGPATGEAGAGTLVLRIVDTGIGVDPAEVDVLFEPFARARSTRDRIGGTGLGLWICRRVVDLLGGSITLAPRPEGGTVALVRLPTSAAAVDAAVGGGHGAGPLDLSRLRVLIADDDDINRFVLRALLRQLGVEPVVAAGGVEARTLLLAEDVDVALLDQRMPDLDGTDVASDVRAARGARPRLVVVTADALPGDRERLLAAGMDDYLAKPVTLEALRVALERVPVG